MGNPNLDDWSHATDGEDNIVRRNYILQTVSNEIHRSYQLHGIPRWGRHEAFAIILEEVEEFKQAVFDDLPYDEVREELIQIAAMCVRYIETEDKFWEAMEEDSK